MYLHERENWTNFKWDENKISLLLETVSHKQGLLYGRLSDIGFDSKLLVTVENLTLDVVHSSEIEGIRLNIEVGMYRTHEEHIISGMFGRERIHYIAPSPKRIEEKMEKFLTWFNSDMTISTVLRSAIAHLWFVSIHPFEDGNGRLTRILSDMMLCKGDGSDFRFYNISSQINKDKNHYYDILERTQRGDGDITEWIVWYAETLIAALDEASAVVSTILNKSFFWQKNASISLTERQTNTLNLFLDGYEAKITSKVWASLNKCSKDTAIRDIQDLLDKNILKEDIPGAKRPSFSIVYDPEDISGLFTDVQVIKECV